MMKVDEINSATTHVIINNIQFVKLEFSVA